MIVQAWPVVAELAAEISRIERDSPIPVRVVRFAENRGLTEALNAGNDACAYPVVAQMGADDVSAPERFEKQRALISQGYDLVATGVVEFETDPNSPTAKRVPPLDLNVSVTTRAPTTRLTTRQ